MPKRLILFDIDGTLMDAGGAGYRSLTLVFQEMFEIQDAFSRVAMAGRTDPQIIREGLSLHGLKADDGVLSMIQARYVETLRKEIPNAKAHLKPGVIDLLEELGSDPCFSLGLLTGNIEQGARIKLAVFGLNRFFPIGAFGSDHEDRNRLLPVALQRYRWNTGADLDYRDCVVIGDTPLDVQCSKPFGALSIVVATGPHSYESLLSAGADCVLRDLTSVLFRNPSFAIRA